MVVQLTVIYVRKCALAYLLIKYFLHAKKSLFYLRLITSLKQKNYEILFYKYICLLQKKTVQKHIILVYVYLILQLSIVDTPKLIE